MPGFKLRLNHWFLPLIKDIMPLTVVSLETSSKYAGLIVNSSSSIKSGKFGLKLPVTLESTSVVASI